jgi:hypothetical protein
MAGEGEAGSALIAQQKAAWETGYKNIAATHDAAKNALTAMQIGVNINKQERALEDAAMKLQLEQARLNMQANNAEVNQKIRLQQLANAETNATALDAYRQSGLNLREREIIAKEATAAEKLKTRNQISDDEYEMAQELNQINDELGTPAWDIHANEIWSRHTAAAQDLHASRTWDHFKKMQDSAKAVKNAALANDQKNFDFMAKHSGVTPYDLRQPFGLWGYNEPDDNHPEGSFYLAHDSEGRAIPWQSTTEHSGWVDKDGNEVQVDKDTGKPPAGSHPLFSYATVDAREAQDMTETAKRLRETEYSHLYNKPAPVPLLSQQEMDQQQYMRIMSDPNASPQARAAAINYFAQIDRAQRSKQAAPTPVPSPNAIF